MSEFKDLPIENLPQYVNEDIASGVSETQVFACSVYDIDTFPETLKIGEAGFTLDKAVVLSDDIVFKTDRGFFQMTVQTETGEVKNELGGNKGNKKAKNMFDFYVANNNAGNLGFVDIYRNVPMVMVVLENTGRHRVIGSVKSPAYMDTVAATSGKGPDDDNGIQITVSDSTGRIAPIYEGNITLIIDAPAPPAP
ncbi:hypothetical protein [Aquimarina algiphila]|uniref:hypothetical protein n=1 Tax=Aquimarina algiphila TaxID=2047982 RepID=UPI00232CACCD|nr:hypothetical protein [Aquimarina algiphila]